MFNKKYPFDPVLKHHLLIALCLAVWVFFFLYFTEPLDTSQLSHAEQLLYLPLYGIAAAVSYVMLLKFQSIIYRKNTGQWTLLSEIFLFLLMFILGLFISRAIYRYIVVPNEPNAYTFGYFTKNIYVPAVATVFPVLIIGRWGFGKYYERAMDKKKIEIKGEGTYEGLRIALERLIAIKAEDNYVEVFYIDDNSLKKQLIRNRLSQVEKDVPGILRTHRSYLINPHHFHQFKMESGKLHVQLSSNIAVPVSKTYVRNVKKVLSGQ